MICNYMQELNLENMFIAVSRAHNGLNIGKQRFDLIRQSCVEVLQKLKEK